MLTQRDFEQKLLAEINDAEIVARYEVGDPLVVQQIRANAAYLALLAREIDVASLEPFIKTRERSIIADLYLIQISETTKIKSISYTVYCIKKKK